MEGYLGEEIVDIKDTEFKDFGKPEWMMYYLESYGGFDGEHHKAWVLDQMARIYNDTEVIIKVAKWGNNYQEYRIDLGEPSKKYLKWVKKMKSGEDGPDSYDYDEGCAP